MFLIDLRLKIYVLKAIDKYPFLFDSVPDQYKTPEMCENIDDIHMKLGPVTKLDERNKTKPKFFR